MGGDVCILRQKPTRLCKAIILQLKKKRNYNKLGNHRERPTGTFEPFEGLNCFSVYLACFGSGVTFLVMM